MRLDRIVRLDPVTVTADASALTAARVMRDHHVGALPVLDQGRPVGILTDRDLTLRCLASEHPASDTPVRDVMTSDPVRARDEDTPDIALDLMATNHVRRLLVVDDRDHLVGLLTIEDLASKAELPAALCATIRAIAAGAKDTT